VDTEEPQNGPARSRPVLSLRLQAHEQQVDGEILLDDLTKIAETTQKFVRQIARSMAGQRKPGRISNLLRDATALRLVGLREGSTVLDIAGPMLDESQTFEFDFPTDLGELSLSMLSEGVSALGEGDGSPELPVGFDQGLVNDLDEWLRSLTAFEAVALESHVGAHVVDVEVRPQAARRRLRDAPPQPSLPFVSATQQMLEGTLYALNLNTGTFSIEDAAGNKIRIKVPEAVRRTAATYIGHQVRAIGDAELDERLRLKSFEVTNLELVTDREQLSEQTGFFDKHELPQPSEGEIRASEAWGIDGLTEEESSDFLAALAELR
jgi:hypothetical protein